MKKRIAFNLVLIGILFCLTPLASGAEVIQGKCLNFDRFNQVITVEEYDLNFDKEFPFGHPTGVKSIVNIKKAEIGITPETGDIIRIAYVVNDREKNAIKVMNVSKQNLMNK